MSFTIIYEGPANIAEKDDQNEISIPVYRVDELEKAYKVRNTLAQLDFFSCGKILCHRIQKFVSRWPILSLLGMYIELF